MPSLLSTNMQNLPKKKRNLLPFGKFYCKLVEYTKISYLLEGSAMSGYFYWFLAKVKQKLALVHRK